MNYLVVLNIGGFICPNVLESYFDACRRWGATFYDIRHVMNHRQDFCFNKMLGIRSLINAKTDVKGILYMDGDMLIRADAPSPFETFTDRNKVYMVRDFDDTRWDKNSDSYKDVKNDVSTPWLYNVHKDINWKIPISDIENCTDWFVNAGMFLLYVPEALREIDLFILNSPPYQTCSRYEQALWNYVLHFRNKVQIIPSTWNRINPEIDEGFMKSYIYHFTGVNCMTNGVKRRERTFNWRQVPKE